MSARVIAAALGWALLAGCAQRVSPGADAGDVADAAVDGRGDRGAPFMNVPGVACGPNRCRGEEVCCNAACGVCAFADECVDHGCAGAPRDGGR